MSDLVKRLREGIEHDVRGVTNICSDEQLMEDAADRIEALEAVLRQAYDAMLSCTPEDATTGNVIYAYHDQEAIDSAIEAIEAALK